MLDMAKETGQMLLAPQATGLVLAAVFLAIAIRNRSSLRDMRQDTERFWRFMAGAGIGLVAITLVWIGLFDNWLQLAAEPYRLSRPWASQRVVLEPVGTDVRLVSLFLLVCSSIALGALFARHVGGYLLQVGMLIVVLVAWMPTFIFQQRLNLLVIDASEAASSWMGLGGLTAFWILRTSFGILSIATTWLIATFLLAPFVTLILDVLHLRFSRATHVADTFFAALEDRSDEQEDVPLKSLWRPIRRPT